MNTRYMIEKYAEKFWYYVESSSLAEGCVVYSFLSWILYDHNLPVPYAHLHPCLRK